MSEKESRVIPAFFLFLLIIHWFSLRAVGVETRSSVAWEISASQEPTGKQSAELAEMIKLNNEAVQKYNEGKFREAASLAERALTLAEKALGPIHLDVANSLINLGSVYMALGELPRAGPLFERVLAIREKLLGPEHPGVAAALTLLGNFYRETGNYTPAEKHLNRALSIYEQQVGPEDPGLSATLNALGRLSVAKGEFNLGEKLFFRGLAISEKQFGPEHSDVAIWLNNLALVFMEKQEYVRAEEALQRVMAIYEKKLGPAHPAFAKTLNNLAEIYRLKGDYGRAEQLFQRAIGIQLATLGPESPDLANTVNNLARLYYDQGEYAKARPLYLEAVRMREKVFGPDHPEFATSVFNLALLYEAIGDYSQAHALHQWALDIREKALGQNHPLVAQSLSSLGGMYRIQGKYIRGEPLLQRALKIYETLWGQDSINLAGPLNNLARLYIENGEFEKGKPLAQRALAISERGYAEHHEVAVALSNLALINTALHDYDLAEELLQRGLKILQKAVGPQHREVASLLSTLAALYGVKGDEQRAVLYFKHCLEIREHNLSFVSFSGSAEQKRLYLESLSAELYAVVSFHVQTAPSNPSAGELAFTTLLRHKGRALDAMSLALESLRRNLGPNEQDILDRFATTQSKLATLTLKGPGNNAPNTHQEQILQLQVQAEALQDEISRHSQMFGLRTKSATIDEVRQALPQGSVLIELSAFKPFNPTWKTLGDRFGPMRYAAYVLRKDGGVEGLDLGDAAEIDAKATRFQSALRCYSIRTARCLGIPEIKKLAHQLYVDIIRPLRERFGTEQHIFLAPDGALNLIPFAALVDDRGKYLVESLSITYLTSGRDLLRSQIRTASRQSPFLIADPLFNGGSVAKDSLERSTTENEQRLSTVKLHFSSLQGTREEVKALKLILPSAIVLTQAEATESSLKQVNGPSILHIATHGFFLTTPDQNEKEIHQLLPGSRSLEREIAVSGDPLLRSGLALEGANRGNGVNGEDGILTALEVAGLNLLGTKLVVLSACDTGVGDVKYGDGVYGLRRALVLAGSEAQVMSLWKVSDAGTRNLMIAFYKRLQSGVGRTEALRQVQLAMLRGQLTATSSAKVRGTTDTGGRVKRDDYRRPYYWAAFIQSGDWRSLEDMEHP